MRLNFYLTNMVVYRVDSLYFLQYYMIMFMYQVKIDEQERLILDLRGALQQSGVEADRRLTTQQKEYEQKIQLLMHQLMESPSNSNPPVAGVTDLEHRYRKSFKCFRLQNIVVVAYIEYVLLTVD